jgi:hypothetical protein
MSLVEEARVMRLEGDSKGDVVDDPRFSKLMCLSIIESATLILGCS